MSDGLPPGLWSARGARRTAVAAAVLTLAGLGAVGLHRGLAESTDARSNRTSAESSERTAPRLSDAALAERTAAMADLENGFTAIADRLEPSVVSINVEKRMAAQGPSFRGLQGMDPNQFFRQFNLPDQGDDDAPQQPRARRPRTFSFPQEGGQPEVMMGEGSGVIVRPDGWILTNDHVVGGADKVTVTLHDGRHFTGEVRRDFRSDLAVVKIPATGLEPAEFADSDSVRVGQWAVAFGSPFELQDTMTLGIISARQRHKTISEDGETRFYPSLLQTDASINPGNSGGPLVDVRGRVMGINVAINTPSGGSVGIGFAIPSDTARDIMNQLISHGKVVRGFLGVTPEPLTPEQRATYGVHEGGALVESVQDGSPAAKAGLQVEDVIVRYNGQAVKDDINLRDLVARTEPGGRAEMTVRRDGHELTLTATVGSPMLTKEEKDAQGVAPAQAAPKPTSKLGVTVEAPTAENTKQFKLDADVHGVIITDVLSGSPASAAGLQPGMAIVRVNGRDIRSADDLRAAVDSVPSGHAARLVVQMGSADGPNMRQLVTVTVP